MKRYKSIKVEDIPDLNWEGYYWYSDKANPEILHGEKLDKSIFTSLPFVIEANFYSREKEISIQIKNIDGKLHVAQIDLNNLKNKLHFQEVIYKGHDIDVETFKMIEAWEEIEDEPLQVNGEETQLLAGFKTLKPAWTAFAGFVD